MRPRRLAARPSAETIRVVMVEPRTLLGFAIRDVLDQEAGIEVVAQVGSPDEALDIADAAAPDVILMSGPLEEPAEADAARRLRDGTPRSAMVVLGGADDDASIVGAVQIGATGHIPEVAPPAELVETIRRVADGEDQLLAELTHRPDLVGRIITEVRHSLALDAPPENPLTTREREILMIVASGLRNRAIAMRLDLSEQTVKNHVTAILHKLGAANRTRAVMYAVRQGWIELPDRPEADWGGAPALRLVSDPEGVEPAPGD